MGALTRIAIYEGIDGGLAALERHRGNKTARAPGRKKKRPNPERQEWKGQSHRKGGSPRVAKRIREMRDEQSDERRERPSLRGATPSERMAKFTKTAKLCNVSGATKEDKKACWADAYGKKL
jgi:hypothetical protein